MLLTCQTFFELFFKLLVTLHQDGAVGASAVFDIGLFSGFLRFLAGSNTPFERLAVFGEEVGRGYHKIATQFIILVKLLFTK